MAMTLALSTAPAHSTARDGADRRENCPGQLQPAGAEHEDAEHPVLLVVRSRDGEMDDRRREARDRQAARYQPCGRQRWFCAVRHAAIIGQPAGLVLPSAAVTGASGQPPAASLARTRATSTSSGL